MNNDRLKMIMELDAKGVQGELAKISAATYQLAQENKELAAANRATAKEMAGLEKEMNKLEKAGEKNSTAYKELENQVNASKKNIAEFEKQIAANTKAMSKNDADFKKVTSSMKISDMTFNQLKQRAKELQSQLNNTSKAANPQAYNALQKELNEATKRMDELGNKSEFSSKGLFKTFTAANLVSAGIQKVGQWISDGIKKIVDFTKESIKMAGEAQGVSDAFKRFGNEDFLEKLRKSAGGLINDFNLMKDAVKAHNFGVPLQTMAKLLEFAGQRARDTGADINELVNSMLDGIGRKSPRAFATLGISTETLRNEVKKTGDFTTAVTNIIDKNMQGIGASVATASEIVEQKNIAWQNLQLKWGELWLPLTTAWNKFSTNIINGLTKIISGGEDASKVFYDHLNKVADLEVNTLKLAERYNELKNKTHLNKNEQIELNKILKTLKESTVPGLVMEYDKMGNVIGINTTKLIEYINTQKILLKYEKKDAIAEATKNLEKYKKKWEKITPKVIEAKRYKDAFFNEMNQMAKMGTFRPSGMTQKQYDEQNRIAIENAKKQYEIEEKNYIKLSSLQTQYNETYQGALLEKNKLDGTDLETQLMNQEARIKAKNDYNKMTKKQLADQLKTLQEHNDDMLSVAQEVYNSKFGGGEGGSGGSGEDKAFNDAKKRLEDKQKLENAALEQSFTTQEQYNKDLRANQKKHLDEMLELYKKYGKNTGEIQEQITKFNIEQRKIDYENELKTITDSEEQQITALMRKLADRKITQENFEKKSQKIVDESLKNKIELAKKYGLDISALEKQQLQNSIKANQDADKANLKAITDTNEAVTRARDAFAQAALLRASQEAKSAQDFENKKKKIEEDGLLARIVQQQHYVEMLKTVANPNEEQKKLLADANTQLLALQTQANEQKLTKERENQEKIKQIREQYGLVSFSEQFTNEMNLLEQQHEQKLISEEDYEKAKLQLRLKYAQQYTQSAQQFISTAANAAQAIEEAQTAKVGAEYEKRHAALTEQYNQGLISQEDYNAQKEQLDYEQKSKELEIQKKYADVNFAMQVAQIIATTAQGIITAWATSMQLGPIAGPIAAAALTALLGITSIAQIAKAKAERDRVKAMTLEAPGGGATPQPTGQVVLKEGFAEGGYTGAGDKYQTKGYFPNGAPYHADEYVIPKEEMHNPALVPMVRAIDAVRRQRTSQNPLPSNYGGGFSEGGFVGANSQNGLPDEYFLKMAAIFNAALDRKLRAEVNIFEFRDAENTLKSTQFSKR